jgi:hypothetical protein
MLRLEYRGTSSPFQAFIRLFSINCCSWLPRQSGVGAPRPTRQRRPKARGILLNWNPGSQERLYFTKLFALRFKIPPGQMTTRKFAKSAKKTPRPPRILGWESLAMTRRQRSRCRPAWRPTRSLGALGVSLAALAILARPRVRVAGGALVPQVSAVGPRTQWLGSGPQPPRDAVKIAGLTWTCKTSFQPAIVLGSK